MQSSWRGMNNSSSAHKTTVPILPTHSIKIQEEVPKQIDKISIFKRGSPEIRLGECRTGGGWKVHDVQKRGAGDKKIYFPLCCRKQAKVIFQGVTFQECVAFKIPSAAGLLFLNREIQFWKVGSVHFPPHELPIKSTISIPERNLFKS